MDTLMQVKEARTKTEPMRAEVAAITARLAEVCIEAVRVSYDPVYDVDCSPDDYLVLSRTTGLDDLWNDLLSIGKLVGSILNGELPPGSYDRES